GKTFPDLLHAQSERLATRIRSCASLSSKTIMTPRTLRILLTRFGHECERTPASQACKSLESEVGRTLRLNPEAASPRLIAVSGYGHDDDRERSREAGFDLHLTKPVPNLR